MRYPDNFDSAAHDARYGDQAGCLVDDWNKSLSAVALAQWGALMAREGLDDRYRATVALLDELRTAAFDDCTCGRCGDSDNFDTDGESLINDAMVLA